MRKAIGMAKLSAKGGLKLFLGVSISSIVTAVGVIVLMRLLTSDECGLAAFAMILYTLIGLFRDLGVNLAMIKYVAQYNSFHTYSYRYSCVYVQTQKRSLTRFHLFLQ